MVLSLPTKYNVKRNGPSSKHCKIGTYANCKQFVFLKQNILAQYSAYQDNLVLVMDNFQLRKLHFHVDLVMKVIFF